MKVRLRPVATSDLDFFDRSFADADGVGEFQWFGFTDPSRMRRSLQESGLLSTTGGVLTIEADGEPVGRVEWFSSAWGRTDTATCWTIAIGLVPVHRGKGIGTLAQRQLVDYLFAHTRPERIQAYTDVENLAERGALENAGFSLEGVLKAAQWRAGKFHDMALYSLVRTTHNA